MENKKKNSSKNYTLNFLKRTEHSSSNFTSVINETNRTVQTTVRD